MTKLPSTWLYIWSNTSSYICITIVVDKCVMVRTVWQQVWTTYNMYERCSNFSLHVSSSQQMVKHLHDDVYGHMYAGEDGPLRAIRALSLLVSSEFLVERNLNPVLCLVSTASSMKGTWKAFLQFKSFKFYCTALSISKLSLSNFAFISRCSC